MPSRFTLVAVIAVALLTAACIDRPQAPDTAEVPRPEEPAEVDDTDDEDEDEDADLDDDEDPPADEDDPDADADDAGDADANGAADEDEDADADETDEDADEDADDEVDPELANLPYVGLSVSANQPIGEDAEQTWAAFAPSDGAVLVDDWEAKAGAWDAIAPPLRQACDTAGPPLTDLLWDDGVAGATAVATLADPNTLDADAAVIGLRCTVDAPDDPHELWNAVLVDLSEAPQPSATLGIIRVDPAPFDSATQRLDALRSAIETWAQAVLAGEPPPDVEPTPPPDDPPPEDDPPPDEELPEDPDEAP